MDGILVLGSRDRKRLLDIYRGKEDHAACVRLRAHIVLLLADGQPWSLIAVMLICSTATIARWKARFLEGGLESLLEERRGKHATLLADWVCTILWWVRAMTPRAFGYCRSRWCCATIVLILLQTHHLKVSVETVRRLLHRHEMVWRRPRPVLGPVDPQREWKLRQLRELLRDLPADEAAVFQDEVDLNLNPDIGCMWMKRGEQAQVVTPGNNVKRYLAGSMSWRSGELILTQGTRRNAELFVRHLDDLRRAFRHYRIIHVICDNACFHTIKGSKLVREYLAKHGQRVKLHYLPVYSPKDNPIERVWWHLHEQITRNHQCQCIEELIDLTMLWIEEHGGFKIEGAMYERLKAAA